MFQKTFIATSYQQKSYYLQTWCHPILFELIFFVQLCMLSNADLANIFCPNMANAVYGSHLAPELIEPLFDFGGRPDTDNFDQKIESQIYKHLKVDADCKRNVNTIYGKNRVETQKRRGVVFLQHGLLGQSGNWVANLPNQSLAYILADKGFDVWIGNSRGNTYSTKHQSYSSNSMKFWKFSFDEMAQFDLPASINFILNETGDDKLWYIGHSQGALIGFAAFGKNIRLSKKIFGFFALAPVARVGHIKHKGMRCISRYQKTINFFRLLFRLKSFQPSDSGETWWRKMVCSHEALFWLCRHEVKYWIQKHGAKHTNISRIPVFMCHNPAGTSYMNMLHWAQLVESGKFQMYDWGTEANIEKYNQKTPPLYKPENLKIPVWLFTGGKDTLADPKDVEWLTKKLEKSGQLRAVYETSTYDHYDFIFANDLNKSVFDRLIGEITKF